MSDRCPISGKYVARSNPLHSIVLSPEGEEVNFCCPSHKTRYLRENPGSRLVRPQRARRNFRDTTGMKEGAFDSSGRFIPEKYLAGLSKRERAQRIKELGQSRDEYGTGDWSELPSDRTARKKGLVKLSAYRQIAQARGFDISQVSDFEDMAEKALRYYTGSAKKADVQKLGAGLKKVYGKGLAAWKSGGHRPGASARNWGDARVASVLVGGKAAWTADGKQFGMLPLVARKKVVQQLPELYAALEAQGRQRDVSYIKNAARKH